ncbi:hypothetical protein PK28_17715 (plasmid) [Hymenobacter sp. DG25B]|jgi:hypothetical protein|uniref:hypothetical protein n=1 Tax=Hymenobacter sp. DG25B TaxID=1385664 RepID=UPI000541141B|nr:hypothetical protein [Hymenobacter sp. DG25B]AIZ65481.1 hypothetical protein PK28_17715 [Hymenobacter sp. DG25B]
MKKNTSYWFYCVALLATMLGTSCSKDEESTPEGPTVALSKDDVSGKSGQQVESVVTVTAPGNLKSLTVSKQVNLQNDNTFGTNGTQTVQLSGTEQKTFTYNFTYTQAADEVDKLVGFTFKAVDANGKTAEKVLTVNTAASGAQILATYRWNLKSKLHTTPNPDAETITDCEKDDSFVYNENGTMAVNYGTQACTFDGFNVYKGWTLSADEQVFTQTYESAFDPSKVTVETYKVLSLTKDRLVMEITLDLSVFGPPYTSNETFVYTFDASPK